MGLYLRIWLVHAYSMINFLGMKPFHLLEDYHRYAYTANNCKDNKTDDKAQKRIDDDK